MGKSPRKTSNFSAKNKQTSSKNIQNYGKKKVGGKKNIAQKHFKRKFSIAKSDDNSDSSLTSITDEEPVSEDDEDDEKDKDVQNFYAAPVFSDTSDDESGSNLSDEEKENKSFAKGKHIKKAKKYWRSASIEVDAIMGLSSQNENNDDDEDEDDSSDYYSSSDDSEVDFVKLTAERKAKSLKAAKALKNPASKANKKPTSSKQPKKSQINHRKSISKQLRKSFSLSKKLEPELPDINFTFEFDNDDDDLNNLHNDNDLIIQQNDEDIGEEVDFSIPSTPNFFNIDSDQIVVPKITESEFNSDDDYEIDDDALIATLQEDNDLAELHQPHDDEDDDEDEDGFDSGFNDDDLLKQEENALLQNLRYEHGKYNDNEDDFFLSNQNTPRNSIIESINELNGSKATLQYASENDSDFDSDDEEDESDFQIPFFENETPNTHQNRSNNFEGMLPTSGMSGNSNGDSQLNNHFNNSNNKNNGSSHNNLNNDSDDDSYLWNYFLSDGNDSDDDDEEDEEGADEDSNGSTYMTNNLVVDNDELIMQQILREVDGDDSGDSTDEDLTIPPPSNKKILGAHGAKEVLSSSTADARPPLLGTWATVHTKPFSIIDGLTTRSLLTEYRHPPQSLVLPSIIDEPLKLDELLNISELEDNDNSEIWKEYNVQQQQEKKSVIPLSAFRNKGLIINSNSQSELNLNINNLRKLSYSNQSSQSKMNKKMLNIKPKKNKKKNKKFKNYLKLRRRASIAESAAEGLISTKSGLFSENALAEVEKVLADMDDGDDLLNLFKGLSG